MKSDVRGIITLTAWPKLEFVARTFPLGKHGAADGGMVKRVIDPLQRINQSQEGSTLTKATPTPKKKGGSYVRRVLESREVEDRIGIISAPRPPRM